MEYACAEVQGITIYQLFRASDAENLTGAQLDEVAIHIVVACGLQ